MRERICKRLIKFIENQENYHCVNIGLIGGEVTILKDFPNIMTTICGSRFKGKIKFYVTTNFSQDVEYFCQLCDIIQRSAYERKLHISASFYPEYTSREGFIEKIKEIDAYIQKKQSNRSPVDLLLRKRQERKISLSAGIPIFSDTDYNGFLDMCAAFEDTCIDIKPIIIRKYHTEISDDVTKALLKNVRKGIRVSDLNGNEYCFQNIQALGTALEDRDSFCPSGYCCDAGIHNIWIDAFGNVKRCPAIGNTMGLGNIINGSFRLLDAPAVCTSDHCSCNQFGRIEKLSSIT